MPTLPKPQLSQSESPWGATYDQMYLELCKDRAPILTALGFYAEHDLPPQEINSNAVPTKDEEEELRQIASALTLAAAASVAMPPARLVATLNKVSNNPSLFFARELPAPVEWAIACDYQRRAPGDALGRCIGGGQVAAFPGEVEEPTEANSPTATADEEQVDLALFRKKRASTAGNDHVGPWTDKLGYGVGVAACGSALRNKPIVFHEASGSAVRISYPSRSRGCLRLLKAPTRSDGCW